MGILKNVKSMAKISSVLPMNVAYIEPLISMLENIRICTIYYKKESKTTNIEAN